MCPDKKLKWFKDHGRTAAQIKEIKKTVIKRWDESYKPKDMGPEIVDVAPKVVLLIF
jgi:hypothetical protein